MSTHIYKHIIISCEVFEKMISELIGTDDFEMFWEDRADEYPPEEIHVTGFYYGLAKIRIKDISSDGKKYEHILFDGTDMKPRENKEYSLFLDKCRHYFGKKYESFSLDDILLGNSDNKEALNEILFIYIKRGSKV